jgi:hypothetical protein
MSDIASSLKNDIAAHEARYSGRSVYRFSLGHSFLKGGVGFSFDVLVDQADPDLAVEAANKALAKMGDTFDVRGALPEPFMNGTLSLNPTIQVTVDDIVDGPYPFD